MGTLAENRYAVCLNHPMQQEIFKLETLLIESGYAYSFNFWEDLRPVFGGGEDGDPESIDWENYDFLIGICGPEINAPVIGIQLSREYAKECSLLDVWITTAAVNGGAITETHRGLTAPAAMEIIKGHIKKAR